jgi:inositol 1,4,5-triphosphate receptor type 1/inositol 1,4,5-triphosphate receptor type 3
MKNFIRVQHDPEGSAKMNSINLIEFTTSQLRIFMRIINTFIIAIPNFMLDFLNEVIQLPCLHNQLTLCKTTFFEDSCFLSQVLSDPSNME